MNNYMIGQRVIYKNVVCTVCAPNKGGDQTQTWIDNPEVCYRHWAAEDNLKPLPNGQL